MSLKFKEDFYEEIKKQLDIVDVISEYLSLKREGSNYKAVCPFHPDRNPSLYVSPSKQIWKCFGCGKGGDVIKFVAEYENLTYFEASLKLAEKYGIDIDIDLSSVKNEREKYTYALKKVCNFYKKQLIENKKVRDYLLKERKLSVLSINSFELGYSPNDDSLIKFAKKEEIFETLLELKHIKKGIQGYRDIFQNRLIFPIKNLKGEVIAFAGRVIENNSKVAKYINSPNTEIFKKENTLFGLYEAKDHIKEKKQVFIVEGYFDTIRFHEKGIKNTVACMGTHLSSSQIKFLKKLGVEKFFLIFDGDEAGKNALIKNAKILFKKGINPYLIMLPNGFDPDIFLQEYSKKEFLNYLKHNKIKFWDWTINKIQSAEDTDEKSKLIKDALNLVNGIEDKIKKSLYLKDLQTFLGETNTRTFLRKNTKQFRIAKIKNELETEFLYTFAILVKNNLIDTTFLKEDEFRLSEKGRKLFREIKKKNLENLPFEIKEIKDNSEMTNYIMVFKILSELLKDIDLETVFKLIEIERKIKAWQFSEEDLEFYNKHIKILGKETYEYIKNKYVF
jgi:DNA primase